MINLGKILCRAVPLLEFRMAMSGGSATTPALYIMKGKVNGRF